MKVLIKKKAQKEIRKLPRHIQNRVLEKIAKLQENPKPPGVKKLTDREEYRVRVGDYRIVYFIENDIVYIVKVGDRKDIYRLLLVL